LTEILTEIQTGNGKILAHLTGIKLTPLSELTASDTIKEFMYFQLADYLSDPLDTLRPPAPPADLPLSELGTWVRNQHRI
jgi:hypothetical protein